MHAGATRFHRRLAGPNQGPPAGFQIPWDMQWLYDGRRERGATHEQALLDVWEQHTYGRTKPFDPNPPAGWGVERTIEEKRADSAREDETYKKFPITGKPSKRAMAYFIENDKRTPLERFKDWWRCSDAETPWWVPLPDDAARAACYTRNAAIVTAGLVGVVASLWLLRQLSE